MSVNLIKEQIESTVVDNDETYSETDQNKSELIVNNNIEDVHCGQPDQTNSKNLQLVVSFTCYVISTLLMVYFLYTVVSTVNTINDYYSQYDMSAGFGETLGYVLQNGVTSLVFSIIVFLAGNILRDVSKALNKMKSVPFETDKGMLTNQIDSKEKNTIISIACYIIAGSLMVYSIYTAASTINTINDYYSSQNASAGFGETISYVLQNGLVPFASSVVIFTMGLISQKSNSIIGSIIYER